jgi:asparagine synthase (glutamine-hydrolysing)
MCGVLGFVDKRRRLGDAEHDRLCRRMMATIAHRGGEGSGVHRVSNITLAHTRLRILDLDARSDQPFASPQSRAVLTFNGQIYNHLALKAELAKHFKYRTASDTETLLYAYSQWGRRFVDKLRGMFAFGIWDKDGDQIVLGVDHLGIKPLYYLNSDDWFAWSSEVKPLLLLPGVRPTLDESALHEFTCYRSLTGSRTMFEGIRKIAPAQLLVYDIRRGGIQRHTYWQPEAPDLKDRPATAGELREALHASVAEHAPADVPVGIQLSGGLDSSLLARLMRSVLPKDYELHSYCIGPHERSWGEFSYARDAAKAAKTIHHEIRFDDEIFAGSLHKATKHLDEPINHPNTVPLMLLADQARKSVTVLFSGEGADELFCGYKRHVRFLRERSTAARLAGSNRVNSIALANAVFRDRAFDVGAERQAFAQSVLKDSPAQQLTLYDLHHHLPSLLLRQDKMGMAANLEIRVPYLDNRLINVALALSDDQKIAHDDRKRVLKDIGKACLPQSVLRRQKRGFGLPVARWLRGRGALGRMFQGLLLDDRRRSFLNYAAIGQLYGEHQNGSADNSDVLWPLLSLEIWCRCFLDGEAARDQPFNTRLARERLVDPGPIATVASDPAPA